MKKNIYHDFYRSSKLELQDLPIAVLHCGHYIFQPTQKAKIKQRDFLQIIWTFTGKGKVYINDCWHDLPKDCTAVLRPGRHQFQADKQQEWEFYTLALEGELVLTIADQLKLNPAVYTNRNIATLDFKSIQDALSTPGSDGEQTASHLAYKLLLQISNPSKACKDKLVSQALEFIKTNWNSPDLTIEKIAKQLSIHRSTLCRRFQNTMHVAPNQYIINIRLQRAMSLLRASNYTISQVAYECGYSDPDYFSRFFKKQTGVYPGKFRSTPTL